MRATPFAFALLLPLLGGCASSGGSSGGGDSGGASAEATVEWRTDHPATLAAAKRQGRRVLVDFTGSDWCVWCKRLEGEVFESPEFQRWAGERFVLLRLDYPQRTPQSPLLKRQNQELLAKYQIQEYPTVLFLDADGTEVGRTGYVPGGPTAWLSEARKVLGEPEPAAADATAPAEAAPAADTH